MLTRFQLVNHLDLIFHLMKLLMRQRLENIGVTKLKVLWMTKLKFPPDTGTLTDILRLKVIINTYKRDPRLQIKEELWEIAQKTVHARD